MSSQWQEAVDRFAHSRACVKLAVNTITTQRHMGNLQYYTRPDRTERNTHEGPTYVEIRLWIKREKGFIIENIGARCRELYDNGEMRKETEANGTVHVYPVKEVSM